MAAVSQSLPPSCEGARRRSAGLQAPAPTWCMAATTTVGCHSFSSRSTSCRSCARVPHVSLMLRCLMMPSVPAPGQAQSMACRDGGGARLAAGAAAALAAGAARCTVIFMLLEAGLEAAGRGRGKGGGGSRAGGAAPDCLAAAAAGSPCSSCCSTTRGVGAGAAATPGGDPCPCDGSSLLYRGIASCGCPSVSFACTSCCSCRSSSFAFASALSRSGGLREASGDVGKSLGGARELRSFGLCDDTVAARTGGEAIRGRSGSPQAFTCSAAS